MTRKDAWSKEDDNYLTTIVLTYISSGETQLKAFDEVGLKLERTSAACGFRWNSFLRNKHLKEILEAKSKKLNRKLISKNIVSKFNFNTEDVIQYLKALRQAMLQSEAQIKLIRSKIQDVSLEIDSRRSEMSLNASQNRDALAALMAKASELGLFEHNKKPAI
ncbi:hypothetical protein ACFVQB_14635 [Paenibacillus sp. NPDC057886]|uniref:hypothetical protein n=1 Tax=Paenibacillus sp. NPDC057886 TaxID=3346270 RepID=UPI0036AEF97B